MMAAFMSEMLAIVHESANGATMDAVSRGIDVPFQGVLLRLDASFEGLDTTIRRRDRCPGQHAPGDHRRVCSGLANANTGHNEARRRSPRATRSTNCRSGDFVNVIDAGDATAANQDNLVVVCQRINADDMDCLEPPTTTTTLPPADPPGTTTTTVATVTPTRW